MAWSSALPLLTVLLSAVVALVGGMWALVKANRVQMAEFVEVRFDALTEVMTSKFDAVDARFDIVDARFDAVGARFDAVDARFDGVDGQFEGVDGRFDGLDTRLDAVDKRIDGVDRRIDEFRADFRALTVRVDRMVEGLPPLLAT